MCLSRWRQRTISYRDCYYRGAISRYLDYPGFPVTDAAVRAAKGYFFARAAQQTLQQSDNWKFARFARLIYSPAVELGRLRTIHPSEVLMTVNSPWEESLDALAAAPAQHRLLFENAHVRVLDTRIAAGERTPVHTHRWPAAHYVVSWSDFIRRNAEGVVLWTPERPVVRISCRKRSGAMRWHRIRWRTWAQGRCTSSARR
jgi:hypothetical protein